MVFPNLHPPLSIFHPSEFSPPPNCPSLFPITLRLKCLFSPFGRSMHQQQCVGQSAVSPGILHSREGGRRRIMHKRTTIGRRRGFNTDSSSNNRNDKLWPLSSNWSSFAKIVQSLSTQKHSHRRTVLSQQHFPLTRRRLPSVFAHFHFQFPPNFVPMSSSYLCPMFFFVSVCFFILCFGAIASADDGGEWKEANRAKRQYYDESYYGSYYGWQAGRVVGWLLGFLVLMLIICVPCVCCVGIWFLGWFGVRQAMASRRARRREEGPGGGRVMTARDQQEISRRYIESPANAEQRYVYATDRIYAAERRPRTPPVAVHESGGGNAAYASNGVTREVRRL